MLYEYTSMGLVVIEASSYVVIIEGIFMVLYQCQNYFTCIILFLCVNISFMYVIFNMPVSKLLAMSFIFMYTYFIV